MRNYIAFQVTFKKDVTTTVTIDIATSKTMNSNSNIVATCVKSDSDYSEDFDSKNSDGEEPSTEDIQEAY